MHETDRQRATEFLQDCFASGQIDARTLEAGLAGVFAARTEPDLAAVVQSLPVALPLTAAARRLSEPLEIRSGLGRLRLGGRWQLARQTHISADIGSVHLDLTEAEFDDVIIDLHVYTGWGRITIVVPPGLDLQIVRHRGGVRSRLRPPVPGLPRIRLDATTNIGRIVLGHPRERAGPAGRR